MRRVQEDLQLAQRRMRKSEQMKRIWTKHTATCSRPIQTRRTGGNGAVQISSNQGTWDTQFERVVRTSLDLDEAPCRTLELRQIMTLKLRQIMILKLRQIMTLELRQIMTLKLRQIMIKLRQIMTLKLRQIMTLKLRQIMTLELERIMTLVTTTHHEICWLADSGFLQDLAGVLDGFHSCLQEASLGILHLSARCINGLMRARRRREEAVKEDEDSRTATEQTPKDPQAESHHPEEERLQVESDGTVKGAETPQVPTETQETEAVPGAPEPGADQPDPASVKAATTVTAEELLSQLLTTVDESADADPEEEVEEEVPCPVVAEEEEDASRCDVTEGSDPDESNLSPDQKRARFEGRQEKIQLTRKVKKMMPVEAGKFLLSLRELGGPSASHNMAMRVYGRIGATQRA
eukprot:g16732.t1